MIGNTASFVELRWLTYRHVQWRYGQTERIANEEKLEVDFGFESSRECMHRTWLGVYDFELHQIKLNYIWFKLQQLFWSPVSCRVP